MCHQPPDGTTIANTKYIYIVHGYVARYHLISFLFVETMIIPQANLARPRQQLPGCAFAAMCICGVRSQQQWLTYPIAGQLDGRSDFAARIVPAVRVVGELGAT